jgi:RNA polymerase sigma-54 factor
MSQKQILAPRMIQSMEILQLPIQELQDRIEQEVQENPLLDMQENDQELVDEPGIPETPEKQSVDEKELIVGEGKDSADDFERLLNMNDEMPDYFEERTRTSSARVEEDGERQLDMMANMVSRPQSLQDYLHDQLGWHELPVELRQMCDRIIYNLDPNGYLQGRLEDLVEPDAPPEQHALAQKALSIVQKLDPPGVGARDLKECLLLQLKPNQPLYDELHKLISQHLEDLGENRLPLICKKTGLTISQIQEALSEIHKLNPKPGADYNQVFVPNVIPDVFVELGDDKTYKIRLEDGRTPNLFISPYYRQLLMSPETSPETREYIKRKINSAQWLIESIEQRRSTLTKVSQAIVDHQVDFLTKGPEFIKPLKMQQIAEKVGVHVTTVSRAVDDKWMQTPRGIFALRKFFVGGTGDGDGGEVAWDAVRMKLQEVIDHEDKSNPLSDDDLVKALATHGLTLARRTVTKYRKAMKIPSSRQRRDWTNDGSVPAGDDEVDE